MTQDASTSTDPTKETPSESGADSITEASQAMRKLSEERPDAYRSVQEQFLAMGIGPLANPIHNHVNSEHITAALSLASDHDAREFKLREQQQKYRASGRWFGLGTLVVVIVAFLLVLLMFKSEKDVLVPLATGLLSFAAGFGGGFGIGKARGSD